MTNTKLSDTMEEALAYLGRGSYRAHLEPAKRTLVALESRGMIEWANALEVGKTYDTTILWNVTAAGWAFLKDAYRIERPADAGRLTLDEALAEAYTNLNVRFAHPEMGTVRTAGPDTVTVDRDNGVCTRYVVSALHMFRSGDRVTIDGSTIRKPLPVRQPGAPDLDAGRFDLDQALSFAYGFGPTEEDRMAADPEPTPDDGNGKRLDGPDGTGPFDSHWLDRAADRQVHAYRHALLDQEAGSGPGAGPATSGNGWLSMGILADEFRYAFPGAVEVQDSIVFPKGVPLPLMDAVVREANRLTETRDAFARGSVYREHTPEDDMYVDRAAWKAEETRIAALREQLRTSARQRNTFEARNGRAPLCGREMSTGRPCPQHTPEDTREQYTKRDTYGDPIAYRDVPVPADLAGHWYGVEAISWTRGVNASYVQAVRIARGLES